ncbi:anhydro-N-acetylmuramic acid kinase [Pararhizobium mangrovi]|uniref:Anhydro-N-acetylmuramic acid kinase n=2 Tax=Pararhizobium mangrovi TaxID=2590452 RepID=A0A506U4N8_9HYPH|nr:anhydro-N-acetylmuramic acid kinase [Pararhizobium mangrovi]
MAEYTPSRDGILTAVGMMSGTSLDGIDIALVRTDGKDSVERLAFAGTPYDPAFRRRLAGALETAKSIADRTDRPDDLAEIERELTLRHAEALGVFLEEQGMTPADVDLVGFHGQTVLHRPERGLTVQLGDGPLLATRSGLPVVFDMRANDMRHGGEGAPLAPAYHRALAANLPAELGDGPYVFVNIGGISNITYVGRDGTLLAFDSGPGNTLIDRWVERHAGVPFDQGGAIAGEGAIDERLVARYMASDFFTAQHRRSLDRNDFPLPDDAEIDLHDGARTLCRVSAEAIFHSARYLPETPGAWIVSGGGRLNATIMKDLATLAAPARVLASDEAGLDGDATEAEAWAYLAVRSLEGLPLTFPGTTSVREAVTGGVLCKPEENGSA